MPSRSSWCRALTWQASARPRLDFCRGHVAASHAQDREAAKRKRNFRPAQKLFDADAVRKAGGEVTRNPDDSLLYGRDRFVDGFLVKIVPLLSLEHMGVKVRCTVRMRHCHIALQPTLEDLRFFESKESDEMDNVTAYVRLPASLA